MLINLDYFIMFMNFIVVTIFVLFLFLVSFILFQKKNIKTIKKKSLYECGFESFGNARIIFNIQFINIALLFIIFDLEILFLLPWILTANYIGTLGTFSIYLILIFFIFGFIYELLVGSLDWNKKSYDIKKN
jgi:NADH-quinone oxidoreductase subunit A